MSATFALTDCSLGRLLPNRELPPACACLPVAELQLDSRRVRKGDLFVALPAFSANVSAGTDYIDSAVAAGASAVLFDSAEEVVRQRDGVFCIGVTNLATELSAIAARRYGSAASELPLIGITGTNGKTTCSQLLAQLLALAGHSVGVIGTLGAGLWRAGGAAPVLTKTGFTTPDAIASQKWTNHLAQQGADMLVMEVSSHALAQGRVAALEFNCALLTNLSRDHLDYHADMAEYAAAKAELFEFDSLASALVNIDDEFGREMQAKLSARAIQLLSFGVADKADIRAFNIDYTPAGIVAQLSTPWGHGEINTSLLGHFNLSNLLAVIGCACSDAIGLPLAQVLALIPQLQPVVGRMQLLSGAAVSVVVDFAHTPDALEQALQALKSHTDKRITCVFGCGGDRDKGKRAEMGSVAAKLADKVVITSDNPRSEEPRDIVEDILQGVAHDAREKVLVELDRARAIEQAILQAAAGDIVLLAGKGHECEQIFADRSEPFCDADVAEKVLQSLSTEVVK